MPESDRRIIARAVGDLLLDGESARFRWPPEDRDGVVYCGFVNSKNSFGAYTGFAPFLVLGAHADGPNGDGRYIVTQVRVASPDPADRESRLVAAMCSRNGFDLGTLPAP